MLELWNALVQLFSALANVVGVLLSQLFLFALPLFGLMWALFAIDWRKAAPVLKGGAAIPLVMLIFLIGAAWGGIAPSELHIFGLAAPNFWWQTAAVALGVGVALFCGWLQVRAGWFPPEYELFPAAAHGGHGHGDHGHGHDEHSHSGH